MPQSQQNDLPQHHNPNEYYQHHSLNEHGINTNISTNLINEHQQHLSTIWAPQDENHQDHNPTK